MEPQDKIDQLINIVTNGFTNQRESLADLKTEVVVMQKDLLSMNHRISKLENSVESSELSVLRDRVTRHEKQIYVAYVSIVIALWSCVQQFLFMKFK